MTEKNILILPGDGIGPEVCNEAKKIIDWLNKNTNAEFNVEEALIGGAAIDKHSNPFPNETKEKAIGADAILLGAVGGPAWDKLNFEDRPERGLLAIRKELDLFANLRPAIIFGELADASSLKREVISGLNIMIIRELTSGIYFGEPRGVEDIGNGVRKGINTLSYKSSEVQRIARVAFDLARQREKKVCSVDKANVLEATAMWREEVTKIQKKEFPNIDLTHMYVDNAAMQLVRNPKQFDIILTTNMFGDILSDCAAMMTGSLGMLPSASLGDKNSDKCHALYEPVHGSAPDIAGKNIANPIATIMSLVMMLGYSFSMHKRADMVTRAITSVLKAGYRTEDIMQKGKNKVGTSEMGDLIIKELDALKPSTGEAKGEGETEGGVKSETNAD